MDKSESVKELATALSKAQGQIEGAKKDVTNTFFKAKYADLSSVVEAIRQPLSANGLSYVQVVHDAEGGAKVETLILHASGEWLSCGAVSVPVAKADAQGFGSAMTYARRYSLSAAFGVAPEDDDGNAAAKNPPKKEFPTGHDKVDGDKTVGQIVDQNLAMENLEPPARKLVQQIAKEIETEFYTVNAKSAVTRLHAERTRMSEEEKEALWQCINSTVRSNIKKCEDAMRVAA